MKRLRSLRSALALAALLALACSDCETRVLTGLITLRDSQETRIPPSMAIVKLVDATLQDVSHVLIAERTYEGVTELLLAYELTWEGELSPHADYSVSASFYDENGRLIFVTDTFFTVRPSDKKVDFHVVSIP